MAGADEKLKAKVKQQLKERATVDAEPTEMPRSVLESMPTSTVRPPNRFLKRMAKPYEVATFFRELAILVESGYPILRALTLLANKISNRHLADNVEQVAMQVEKGSTMAKAMAAFPWYFSSMIVSMVEAGETGGNLVDSLNSISDDFENDEEINDKMKQALAYPVLTGLISLFVFLAILVFVVPTFGQVYEQHNMDLPASTALLVALSNFVTGFWWIWVPVLAFFGWFIKQKLTANLNAFDGLLLRVPIVGEIIILGSMARFSSGLRVLLNNGVPILQSLELAKGSVTNSVLQDTIHRMALSAESGKSLAQPMAEAGHFPPIMVDMLFVGEESGRLPFVLLQVSRALRLQLDRLTSQMAVTLGPVMTLVVGLMVLVIALSLFVPYFDFLGTLGTVMQ